MSAETIEPAAADADAAPLDLLLTDAALGVLNRVNPGGSGLRLAAALAARPGLVAGKTRNLLGELARIAAGTSQVQPSRRDRRFADPGWAGNPLLRRVLQAYLASAQTAEGLAQDADLDWADTERVGFVLRNLIDALAPSNNPALNPAALKAAIETGGGSALAGLRHFAADMTSPPRIPSMVEPDAFEVGVDLAVTPGAMVLRTEVFELIQYRPATAAVRQVPLLIVPPTINKTKDVRAAVEKELGFDPGVDATQIAVRNIAGDVTLTGTVPSYPQYLEAAAAARRVAGVTGVHNQLEVVLPEGDYRDDVKLATAANNALAQNVTVPDSVEATAEDGNITLTGTVSYGTERAAAEAAVAGVAGVRNVFGDIEISYVIDPIDVDVHVQEALDRSAAVSDGSDVTADTKDGVITLTGHVRTMAEHDAVVGAALMARGVIDVRDHLEVTG